MQDPNNEDLPEDHLNPEEFSGNSTTVPNPKRSGISNGLEETQLHQDTSRFIAIPRDKFAAPKRVAQVDPNSTLISADPARHSEKKSKPPKRSKKITMPAGCGTNIAIIGLFAFITLVVLGSVVAVIAYFSIAATLPSVADLKDRSAQFETTRILDRNGNSLYELLDPNAGRRTYVTLDQISPSLVAATIATEDKEFYNHPGFDPIAILQAVWANMLNNGSGPGASTITQQLARALLLSPEERVQRSYLRKVREIILSAEITRQYTKDEILELYLNEIYYGNLSYGIEAAASTYFGNAIDGQATETNPQGTTPNGRLADDLNLAQAAFLAGLPQAPAVYDIYTNRDLTLARDRDVLSLMYLLSSEQGCIFVSNWSNKVCVDVDTGLNASKAIEAFNFPTPDIQMRYPHWVNFIRAQLEGQFDAQTIYRSGFTVTTTLDSTLQDYAQRAVSDQITALFDNNARNGALVAIQPKSGEILAMVGSADFNNVDIDGQINMATSETRQPGSSIKPFTYLAAFEKGWTPSTLIWDVPSKFPPSGDPNDSSDPYIPVNYDGEFHGPVTVRAALANSYNIPAVKALQYVGIYDDATTPAKEGLIGMAQRLGIDTFTRNDYGLSLTLGGGEVSLLKMTQAYSVLANKGAKVPTVSILKITDHLGNVIYENKPVGPEQVLSPEHVYLMSSILSDYQARVPMFGSNPVINLPFYTPVAAKTGTTNDYRDNWTMGYSPDIAVGVWVGNADYSEMIGVTGVTGAGPIWANFMIQAIPYLTGGEPTAFERPATIVDMVVCKLSGAQPSKWCPEESTEVFAADQLPLPPEQDLWQKSQIDTWSGLLANKFCDQSIVEEITFNVQDDSARKWIRNDDAGKNLAKDLGFEEPIFFTPKDACDANTKMPTLEIVNIPDGAVLTAPTVDVNVIVTAPDGFKFWSLDLATGLNPSKKDWETLYESQDTIPQPTSVFQLDLTNLGYDQFSLRLYIENKEGGYYQKVVHFENNFVFPTEIPIPTAIDTPIVIPTEITIPTLEPTVEFPTPTLLPPLPSEEPPTVSP